MKFGVYLPNFGPYGDARVLAALACDAEAAGWDGFFIWDHIARSWATDVVDPWIALAAVAVATTRLRIGALVTPIPRRRPWKLARETVSLDHLSGGRLIFAVGIGSGQAVEWDDLGDEADATKRGQMLDEGLAVLDGLWQGESFSYAGEHYRVKEAHFLPRTIQTPRIPVWIAGNWPNKAPMRRAARWDGAFPLYERLGVGTLEAFKQSAAFVREQRLRLGIDSPFDMVYRGISKYGSEGIDHAATFAEAGATWWLEHIIPMVFGDGDMQGAWPLDAMHERIRLGPPK